MASMTYGDFANKTYGDLADANYSLENFGGGGGSSDTPGTSGITAADIASIAQAVWEYANRSLTTSTGGATAQEVWEYANRSLTNPVALTSAYDAAKNAASASSVSTLQTAVSALPNASANATAVWGATTRTLTASPTDISGLTSSLSTLQTSVNAIPTTSAPTAQNIWEYSSRTLTSGGGGNSGITAADVWSYTTRSLTASPIDISGLATASAVSSMQGDVTAIKAKTDGIPDGLGTILNKIYSLIAHWSVSGNTLTIYDSQNNTLGTFTLTKNVEGDITGVH